MYNFFLSVAVDTLQPFPIKEDSVCYNKLGISRSISTLKHIGPFGRAIFGHSYLE